MNRRKFLGAAAITSIIGVMVSGKNGAVEHKKADFGKCACGSKRLWWNDHSEACANGGLIVMHRPDGAQLKIDVCTDCGSMRVVKMENGKPYEPIGINRTEEMV